MQYKDYKDEFVGNRTSKHCDEDMIMLVTKRNIDLSFESLEEDIGELKPVSLEDSYEYECEGNKPSDVVESSFKLGYMQAKKEILKVVDEYAISLLKCADSNYKYENE